MLPPLSAATAFLLRSRLELDEVGAFLVVAGAGLLPLPLIFLAKYLYWLHHFARSRIWSPVRVVLRAYTRTFWSRAKRVEQLVSETREVIEGSRYPDGSAFALRALRVTLTDRGEVIVKAEAPAVGDLAMLWLCRERTPASGWQNLRLMLLPEVFDEWCAAATRLRANGIEFSNPMLLTDKVFGRVSTRTTGLGWGSKRGHRTEA